MANTPASKETVYIDVDDEITTIIDKVRGSSGRIVALVLPKRAAVLQSVVNMKLLKRSAEEAKKQLVLITSETGLLPLAGSVGLHVANTLQSKPEIPTAPVSSSDFDDEDEALLLDDETNDVEYTADNAGDRPVGELANKGAAEDGLVITSGVETEELPKAAGAGVGTGAAAAAVKPAKKSANKKLRVPNFNKFRLRLALAVLAIVGLITFFVLAMFVLPKATVAIGTDAQDVNTGLEVTLDTTASDVELASATIPATAAQQQKTFTKQVDATGEENKGDTASGTVQMTSCVNSFSYPNDIPAGTGISSGSFTYITQEDAQFSPVGPDQANQCYEYRSNKVDITAQKPGKAYNTDKDTDFTVNGRSDVTANGSAKGGTDDIRKVVSKSDIDNASGQINLNNDVLKEALYQQLKQDNLYPIRATFKASDPNISSSSQPGDEASTVTVTEAVTYTMFGTNRSNLEKLVTDDVSQQVDTSKQTILDDGLDKASFSLQDLSDTRAKVSMDNTAMVGPDIDITALQKEIAGKKSGDAKEIINQLPGVTKVDIKLSPFWLTSIPNNPDKITIHVGKAAKVNDGS